MSVWYSRKVSLGLQKTGDRGGKGKKENEDVWQMRKDGRKAPYLGERTRQRDAATRSPRVAHPTRGAQTSDAW